jgi:putative SOS response-associated peptidase YedK
MCGRYTLTDVDGRRMAQRYDFDERGIDPATLGRFNVCPTESVLAVTAPRDGGARVPRTVRWGLVPRSAQAVGKGAQPINVRAETAAGNRWFGSLMAKGGRCLVPADGWYEWLRAERPKAPRVPFHHRVDGGAPFAFAGIWSRVEIGGEDVASAAILTTAANEVCARLHDRMPCVLAGPEEEAAWLSGAVDAAGAAELLVPLDAARTSAMPANPAVNRAGVEGPEMLEAPAAEQPEGQQQLRLA